MNAAHTVLLGICISCLVGCGATESHVMVSPQPSPSTIQVAMNNPGLSNTSSVDAAQIEGEPQDLANAQAKQSGRKIIYNTSVSLNVESFDGISENVVKLTETHGGFIAGARLGGTSGDSRSGTWTIRIPADQYRAFLSSTGSLGEIVTKTEQTREVTSEFYDIEARVRNKQTEEQR